MGVIIGIAVGVFALGAGAVWLFRAGKVIQADADRALQALAQKLGTSYVAGQ